MALYIVFIAVAIFEQTQGSGWSYEGEHGPAHWAEDFRICGQTKQSPIDIPNVLVHDQGLGPFTLSGFETSVAHELLNNGHSVQLNINGNVNIAGGKLGNTFRTVQLHFHWGGTDSVGSEHTFNGRSFPLELHIVNYNTKYDGIADAIDQPDGLAVLGFWFEISENDNSNYNSFLSQFSEVAFKDKRANVTGINVGDLLPNDLSTYYRYQGSLTTPPCFESVTWTLFQTTIPISSNQMQIFRSLSEKAMPTQHSLVNNYRPVQDLNGRVVYTSNPVSSASRLLTHFSVIGCLVFLACHLGIGHI